MDQDLKLTNGLLTPELEEALGGDGSVAVGVWRKILAHNSAFASVSAGQLERHRTELGRGDFNEVLFALEASTPLEIETSATAYFEAIVQRKREKGADFISAKVTPDLPPDVPADPAGEEQQDG